jgi:antitoxin CptB
LRDSFAVGDKSCAPDKPLPTDYISVAERRVEKDPAPILYCGKQMTGPLELGRDDLDLRRKRLHFRAWHRGMREVDLLLGRFADATIAGLDEGELAGFEALLDVPDQQVFAWITGGAAVPAEADSPLLRRLLAFHGTASQPSAKA